MDSLDLQVLQQARDWHSAGHTVWPVSYTHLDVYKRQQFASGVRVAVTGVKGSVFRATAIEAALNASFTAQAAQAVKLTTDGVNSDMHGSAEYRAAMVSVMAGRAVAAALAR